MRIAEQEDILLSVRAPVGPTNFAPERCCIGRGLAAIRSDPTKCSQRYIRYYLQRFESDIAARGVGSTFTAINRKDIERLKLPIPPLPEQKRIVELLDEANALRKLRAQADRRTADLIPAIFQEMFGDPGTNQKKWPVSTAGDLMTICQYGTCQKPVEDPSGTPLIRMNNILADGRIDLTNLKFINLQDGDLAKYQLAQGDVLFNRTNSRDLVGKTGLWDSHQEAVPASYFIRLRLNADKEHPQHFTTFMNLPFMKDRLKAMARGAVGQANINAQELRSINLPVPPISLQRTFAARFADVREMVVSQAVSYRRLDDLFQALLDKAFKGEI